MSTHLYKIILIFVLTNFINISKCRIDLSSSEISSEKLDRHRRHLQDTEYQGLSIEVPSRRLMPANLPLLVEPTTTTTKPVYPPLSRSFRRIYNPDEVASIEEYPFMAAMLVNGQLWCGGVIIDNDKVLTAAHCLQIQYNNRFFREYVKMLSVRVGSTNATAGGEVLSVTEIFFHPNYKPQTLEFNFAVVKLSRNLTFGGRDRFIRSIPYSTYKVVPVDSEITFLGWGSVLGSNDKGGEVLLQKIKLPVYDTADCQDVYGRDLVTRNNFCAGYITKPKNVCNHDAGGPAILDNKLMGILSFSSKRCDTPDQPAVFSSIGAVDTWLENLDEKQVMSRETPIKAPQAAAGQ